MVAMRVPRTGGRMTITDIHHRHAGFGQAPRQEASLAEFGLAVAGTRFGALSVQFECPPRLVRTQQAERLLIKCVEISGSSRIVEPAPLAVELLQEIVAGP